jgi:hypothetical protein
MVIIQGVDAACAGRNRTTATSVSPFKRRFNLVNIRSAIEPIQIGTNSKLGGLHRCGLSGMARTDAQNGNSMRNRSAGAFLGGPYFISVVSEHICNYRQSTAGQSRAQGRSPSDYGTRIEQESGYDATFAREGRKAGARGLR